MAKPRSARLETPTARLRLDIRRRPYPGPSVARGIHLSYRRNHGGGRWIVKASSGNGSYWTRAFATADDYEKSDGRAVLNYHEAIEAAKATARGGETAEAPLTVAGALGLYERDLASRGAAAANVLRVRAHISGALAAKPVALLRAADLRNWRDSLIGAGMLPATINRTAVGLRAALELAAAFDARIGNRAVFRIGLKRIPGTTQARRMVLPDGDVLKIVEAAFAEDAAFGVLVQLLAETGARISQAARIRCGDLQADRVLIPSSFKGKASKDRQHVAVPITADLALKLKAMKGDRAADYLLVIKRDGTYWKATSSCDHRDAFRAAVKRAGFDPDAITSYALRHSSICRSLIAGVPSTIVARLHDTSSRQIESHYSAYILDIADQLARKALLQQPLQPEGNVVALKVCL